MISSPQCLGSKNDLWELVLTTIMDPGDGVRFLGLCYMSLIHRINLAGLEPRSLKQTNKQIYKTSVIVFQESELKFKVLHGKKLAHFIILKVTGRP